jgi:hypothetical protein
MAVYQPHTGGLTHRHRRQASSHIKTTLLAKWQPKIPATKRSESGKFAAEYEGRVIRENDGNDPAYMDTFEEMDNANTR